MTIDTHIRAAVTAALACATICATAHAETVERRAAADPRGLVEIGNVAGSVYVTGWDRAEVEVQAELGDGVERLDFARDGERTIVKVVLPKNTSDHETDLIVHVPRDSRLVINTVSANQVVDAVRGTQRLQTVSGDIDTKVWSGEFEAKTVSGDITAIGQSAKGQEGTLRTRVTAVSGDVILTNIRGELDLNTVSGDLQVTAPLLTRAHIETTNGDLQLSATLSRDARIDVESINGDLHFDLNDAINAEFDIETFNGDIDSCFGPKAKRSSEYGPGNELHFKEGDGSARVRIKTLNGNVRVCR